MKTGTSNRYYQRIDQALQYMVDHVDEELSIDVLAKVAHFSPFHFHRVFSAIVGETIGELVQRMRLELAASKLRNENVDPTIVAGCCGYESYEAFCRAFRRGFGMPPVKYKKSESPPGYVDTPRSVVFNPITMDIKLMPIDEKTNMQINIVTQPETEYAYIAHVGPYQEIAKVFPKLLEWASDQKLDLESSSIFSHSYDSPRRTSTSQLRSEACISISKSVETSSKVKLDTQGAQRVAIYRHQGPYDEIADVYQRMLGQWLPFSDEEIDDAPFTEIYQNDCTTLPSDQWLTDLCIPLK